MANETYKIPRKRHKANNFRFALGMGMNWVDMDKHVIYMVQEYAEAQKDPTIPADKKPKKIKIMNMDMTQVLGEAEPEIIEERMKDPEPDPRYLPETSEERRRSMR